MLMINLLNFLNF